MLAGAGDELQGIKRGIMEMADAIVITKADGTNADKAKMARSEYANALHLFPPTESSWMPEALTCSSLEFKGITEVFEMIEKYHRHTITNNYFHKKRQFQNKQWFHQTLNDLIIEKFYSDASIKNKIISIESDIENNLVNPYEALKSIFKK